MKHNRDAEGDTMMSSNPSTRRIAVVMAGGSGERFWPLSRQKKPKQLLRLTSPNQTMLEEAVSRLVPMIPPKDIYVVTGQHLIEPIREAHVGVPDENVIAEPCKRNTTGCLAYATAHILAKYADDADELSSSLAQARFSMAIVTADPAISDGESFRKTIAAALSAAEQHEALGVVGIVPTRPDTGYGYVRISAENGPLAGYDGPVKVYRVARFHEKPSREKAGEFVESGRCFWNSGMFFWKISTFMQEIEAARPAVAGAIIAMAEAMRSGRHETVAGIFEEIENISIDYALMEHARNVVMARADFSWDDVGAWPALERIQPRDNNGNTVVGSPVAIGCRDCIVYDSTDPSKHDMSVAVVGAEGLVVVVTDDAVLVIPKDRAQDVRYAVEELKRRNAKQV
jgi:mannose-1-phosphate guanylyltransferase